MRTNLLKDRQILSAEDCVGETIAGVGAHDASIVLRFASGQFLHLEADKEPGEYYEALLTESNHPPAHAALRAGLIDESEFHAIAAKIEQRREELLRADYERLKARFEGQ